MVKNMIKNREELLYYLEQDRIALKLYDNQKRPRPLYDEVWKFQIALRKAEYAVNCKQGLAALPYKLWRRIIFHWWSVKCGFSIPLNVFGPGLSIAHYGTIVVNSNSRIGKNCRIQEGVNIGASGDDKAPQIGDNVFIGSGAKIIGDVVIADNIAIGAGAIVVKSFMEQGITIAGNPAKKISNNGSNVFICDRLK